MSAADRDVTKFGGLLLCRNFRTAGNLELVFGVVELSPIVHETKSNITEW